MVSVLNQKVSVNQKHHNRHLLQEYLCLGRPLLFISVHRWHTKWLSLVHHGGTKNPQKTPLLGKTTGKRTLQPRANALYAMHRSPGAGIYTFLFFLNHSLSLKSGRTISEDWTLNYENAPTAHTKMLYMISSQISTDYRCSESYLLLTINHQIEYKM